MKKIHRKNRSGSSIYFPIFWNFINIPIFINKILKSSIFILLIKAYKFPPFFLVLAKNIHLLFLSILIFSYFLLLVKKGKKCSIFSNYSN